MSKVILYKIKVLSALIYSLLTFVALGITSFIVLLLSGVLSPTFELRNSVNNMCNDLKKGKSIDNYFSANYKDNTTKEKILDQLKNCKEIINVIDPDKRIDSSEYNLKGNLIFNDNSSKKVVFHMDRENIAGWYINDVEFY